MTQADAWMRANGGTVGAQGIDEVFTVQYGRCSACANPRWAGMIGHGPCPWPHCPDPWRDLLPEVRVILRGTRTGPQ